MAQMTVALDSVQIPRMVNSQPLPIAAMIGAPTMAPTQERIFRQKLFKATPDDDFRGMNSVNMVVDMANISIDPSP
jgi:hypothetical protein